MNCDRALPLIPLYLDGELSAVQASELRPHLLECPACRFAVQGERALKAWFVPTEAVPVPAGFAARIARRALAGDTGERHDDDAAATVAPILNFALRAVAVAAVALLVFAIAIRRLELPGQDIKADDKSLEETLEDLRRLNDQELAPAAERARAEAEETVEDGAPAEAEER